MCGLIALKSEYFKHTFELWIIHHLHFQCWSTITVLFMQINYSVYNQWNPNYWIWGVALKIKILSEFGRVAVYTIFLVSWTTRFNLNDFICRYLLHLTLWDFLGLTGWDMIRLGMNALMYNVRGLQNMFLHTRWWFCYKVNSFI
jgi:hypothetical protein